MNRPRTFEGEWWIPGECDPQSGVVEFTPNQGASLRLFDEFELENAKQGPFGVREFDIIHGKTPDDIAITLKDCMEKGSTDSKPEYHVSSILYGSHFETNIKFDRFVVELPLLTEWAGISGIRTSLPESNGEHVSSRNSLTIEHYQQEPIETTVDGLHIRLDQHVKVNRHWIGEARIIESTYVEFYFTEGAITYEECLNRAKMFQDILTIATGETILSESLKGFLSSKDTDDREIEILFSNKRRETYSSPINKEEGQYQPPSEFNTYKGNFALADLDEDKQKSLNRLVSVYEEMKPIISSYSAMMNNNLTIDDEFLVLTRIFYLFYQRRTGKPAKEIGGKWPQSFDEILISIIENDSQLFSELNINIESSVEDISEALYYFTSYEGDLDELGGMSRVFSLLLYLRISMTALLSVEMGVDEEQAATRLNRNYNMVE